MHRNDYVFHRWFAWYPVWCSNERRRAWLEFVERMRRDGRYVYVKTYA